MLVLQDVPRPDPGPGQALVRLRAAGVNFADLAMRAGRGAGPLPYTPGLEGAGSWRPWRRTSARSNGATASRTSAGSARTRSSNNVPAAEAIPLPEGVTFPQGAAATLQGATAHTPVHEYYRAGPGDVVLVHAAAPSSPREHRGPPRGVLG